MAAPHFTPDPALYPFESRWFDSSAGRVHYVDEGEGPAILLCHGNPTWSFLYRHLIRRLRGEFRCVAPDYLGFGLSDRPTEYGYTASEHVGVLAELVDHLGLDGYLSMGQDWGGPISLGVAVRHPDRVRGLVLGNTWFWPPDRYFQAFSALLSSQPLQHRDLERNLFVDKQMPRLVHLGAAEMLHYRAVQPARAGRAGRRGAAEFPKQMWAARPLLERLERDVPALLGNKPTLLVWGMKDKAFRAQSVLPCFEAAFPKAEVVKLHKAGHYIQEDAPEEIAAAIRRQFPSGSPDLWHERPARDTSVPRRKSAP